MIYWLKWSRFRMVYDTKYVYKTEYGTYRVRRTFKGKRYSYGTYKTLLEAIKKRDELLSSVWFNMESKKNDKKFINQIHNGSFVIRKNINGKMVHFGTFHNLEDAKKFRDNCVDHDWKVKPKLIQDERDLPKLINSTHSGNYSVRKTINGRTEYFGVFHELSDAVCERDNLIKCGWDYDVFEYLDETLKEDNITWLGRKVSV